MRDEAEVGDNMGTITIPTPSTTALEFDHTELCVEDIMTGTIVAAGPDETVHAAIQQMARYRISCIIVTVAGRALGILTERDVLRGVAARYDEFVQATLAEEMSHPVVSVPPETTALQASALMEAKNIKRLLIARDRQPIGVVTQTDITRGLISMSPFKNIADLMTPDLVTVSESTTMLEAAQQMAARNISCVVVMRSGRAAGIVTEKDVLKRIALCHTNPGTAPVAEIMSFPVVTVPPTHSVMSASRMMDQMRIHRLLVGDAGDIQGIVTQTDIISAVRRKLEQANKARRQHKSEMGRLIDSALSDLSSMHGLVQGRHRGEAVEDDPLSEELASHLAGLQDTLERLADAI
jgi:CBS domain-containing protein